MTATQADKVNKEYAREDKQKERDLDQIWRKGLAGGLAGCAAKTVVAPLERVKILFQTAHFGFVRHTKDWLGFVHAIQAIRQHHGSQALFQGHSVTLLRIFPYAAINFLAYDQIRATLIASPHHETPFRRLISGSLAGAISTSCTYPFELIRVHLAVQTKDASLVATCRDIYRDGGLASFYRGYAPTLLGILPYAGTSFFTHDVIGDWLRSPKLAPYTALEPPNERKTGSKRLQLTAVAELTSGALAGLVAQTVSYPLESIRRRMQVHKRDLQNGRRPSIAHTARTIYLESGLRGFYLGLTIGYIKIMPMVATSFFVYDRMKGYLGVY
ncbi:mitochondrial carrier [Penicillium longicatenatum]|uniref:mitochondrial carrier n=1 Tax=Penicillium longicatenatum TaxID=1561947 RepID=UPI00254665F1|nr:mitochondrial carrier [Penicillium longicatenatum]KAJ5639365.1 mitochondrial carrier [Penicillium longicatenatum]